MEVGIEPEVSCSAATPADIQLMVRSGYPIPSAAIDEIIATCDDSLLHFRKFLGVGPEA
jgi:hypothetical protein